jgi:hypothetical protein
MGDVQMSMTEPIRPRVVTLSSLYGTGDELIGRRVAERLGVVFVDREIPAFVAVMVAYSLSEAKFRQIAREIARRVPMRGHGFGPEAKRIKVA